MKSEWKIILDDRGNRSWAALDLTTKKRRIIKALERETGIAADYGWINVENIEPGQPKFNPPRSNSRREPN
jgi:hypothetical protein